MEGCRGVVRNRSVVVKRNRQTSADLTTLMVT